MRMTPPGTRSRVVLIVGDDGQRTAVHTRGELAIPDFHSTVYESTVLHPACPSFSTPQRALADIASWQDWLIIEGLDWAERKRSGRLLTTNEVSRLINHLQRSRRDGSARVSADTLGARISNLVEYLARELVIEADRDWQDVVVADARARVAEAFLQRLLDRRPNVEEEPEPRSLTPAEKTALARMLRPDALSALWRDPFVAGRNSAFLWFQADEGHRMGELLGMCCSDFNFRAGKYLIRRRHNDPADPRRNQPLVKGFSRELPLSERLSGLVERHIREFRSGRPHASGHDYVFVSLDGHPWSRSGVQMMYARLRQKRPELGPLTSHWWRHNWNENFSREAERLGLDHEAEARARAEQMGWRNPASARSYLRRYARREAARVSESMQRRALLEETADAD